MAQQRRRAGRIPHRESLPALGNKTLEPPSIELPFLDTKQVAQSARLEHIDAQRLAQPGDVDVNRLARVGRRRSRPELLDQAVAGHDLIRAKKNRLSRSVFLRPPSVTGSPSRVTSSGPRIR